MKRIVIVAIAVLLRAADAHAYHVVGAFGDSANIGGGGGMWFTGAPRAKGYDCTICHVDAPRTIGVTLASSPPELFAEGRYVPGTAYAITVTLTGEHAGFGALSNRNTFVMELDDAHDRPLQGGFGGYDPDELSTADQGRVIAAKGQPNETRWTFTWTAPVAGTGALGMYLGAVDADGAGNSSVPLTDPLGDDVFVTRALVCEGAAGCDGAFVLQDDDPDDEEDMKFGYEALGCSVGRRGGGAAGLVVVVLALALARRRAIWLAVSVLVAGCNNPRAPAECRDRVCGDGGSRRDAPPPCDEQWECSPWTSAPAGSNTGMRSCVDSANRGTHVCKPFEGPAPLPALDRNDYECKVEPIFDAKCAMNGCHGEGRGHTFSLYARGRHRRSQIVDAVTTCLDTGQMVDLDATGTGTIMCEGHLPHTAEEWQANFDSARSFLMGVADPDACELLAQPVIGGKSHAGVHLFARSSDPTSDYQIIRAWLSGATLGTCDRGFN